jgi:formylglycine-generating enzyme
MTPESNQHFAAFAATTGYRTTAEIPPRAADYPGPLPHLLRAGSLTLRSPRGPVPLGDARAWWAWTFGASWRSPYGPESSVAGLDV